MEVLVIVAASVLVVWAGKTWLGRRADATTARALVAIEEEGVLARASNVPMTGSWGRRTLHFRADLRVTSRALYLACPGEPLVVVALKDGPARFSNEGRLDGKPQCEGASLRVRAKFGLGHETIGLELSEPQRVLGALALAAGEPVGPA